MGNFFLILTMISLVLFIIGLMNPSLVIFRWKKRRFLVILIYGTMTLISLLLLIITSPAPHKTIDSIVSNSGMSEDQASEPSPSSIPPANTIPTSEPVPNSSFNWLEQSEKYFLSHHPYPDQFSQLNIALVTRYEGMIEITGETDLPDGSLLEVLFRQFSTPTNPNLFDLQTNALIKNKSFQASFLPPGSHQFSQGPFQIRVYFSPQKQIPQIKEVVGNSGEKLKGLKTRVENQVRILEDIKEVSFEFKINTSPVP